MGLPRREARLDPIVLQAVADELSAVLIGRRLGDAVQLESHRFLLRFEEPPFPRLHIGIHPWVSTIHLARGVKAPAAPTELAVALTRALEGRPILRLVKPALERLLRIEFEGGRCLVVELMGKASNLFLLDEHGTILRFARTHKGEFRRPVQGEPYEPPPASSRWRAAGPDGLDEAGLRSLAREAAPGKGLAALLVESQPGFSQALAREVEHRAAAGEDPWQALVDLRARARGGPARPVLYAPGRPEEIGESVDLTARVLFSFVFPLRHATEALGLTQFEAASMNEAEAEVTRLRLRHLAHAALRQSLAGLLAQESRRARDLSRVLEQDLDQAETRGRRDRRWGELLLAGLRSARREGAMASVPDAYDSGGGDVEIPIDPRLDLQANAARYFKSAGRAARARELIPGRLAALRERIARLEALAESVRAAPSTDRLAALEREAQEAGLVKAFRRADRAEVGRRAAYVRVHEFTTKEGFTVLVGRSSSDNDHLTFKVAAPHDLWLHAAGWPGAHVIVRNPKRLAQLPEATVREAAAIAAWFSKGKSEKAMDVHAAFRRHVRKGKGMGPGMVMLKRHRTIRAEPALPPSPRRLD